MFRIKEMILVEGRYDMARLANLVDAFLLPTNGFSIFKDEEKKELIRSVGAKRGIIILTDSDAAGFQIRHYIEKIAAGLCVKNAYIPDVPGKESRKARFSKEGTLGVEGMEDEVLLEALRRCGALEIEQRESENPITYTDLYEAGLSGTPGCTAAKQMLLHRLCLPQKISKRALLQVLNSLYTKEEFWALVREKPVLFFDFHGTLTKPDNQWTDAALLLCNTYFPSAGITQADIDRGLHGKCLPWFLFEDGDTRAFAGEKAWWQFCEDQFTEMFQTCGFSEGEARMLAGKMRGYILDPAHHRLYEDTKKVLQALKGRGYRCFLISNNFPEIEPLMSELGISAFFDGIVVSGLLGYDKPHPEIFKEALRIAGEPAFAVMIGDNPRDDMEGAKKQGFLTVQVNRPPRGLAADYWCDDLTALLSLFP